MIKNLFATSKMFNSNYYNSFWCDYIFRVYFF